MASPGEESPESQVAPESQIAAEYKVAPEYQAAARYHSATTNPPTGDAPHPFSTTRRIFLAILLLGAAATAWWLLHAALPETSATPQQSIALNPGYQHTQRLMVSTARAAMDALAITSGGADAHPYQMDYSVQRMQIQADSEGLERWAARDPHHQGLLRAIRATLAGLLAALDRTMGHRTMGHATAPMHMPPAPSAAASAPSIPLLTALDRAQQALSNYSASLTEPAHPPSQTETLFAGPLLLWWILLLLLVELAATAWLIFPASRRPARR